MKTVLLTGFEAFGHTPIDPAESVARALDQERVGDAQIVGRVVPNVFFECIDVVCAAIEETRPEIVVMMGEFGGRATITVERIAQNLNDSTRYRLADISDAPGTFCCNHLMYGVLHHLTTHDLAARAGWIHLPHLPAVAALPENLGAPSMSVDTAVRGVSAGIRAAIEHETDIDEPSASRLQI